MKNFKIKLFVFAAFLQFSAFLSADAQYKSFKISVKGDTINVVNKDGFKQGKWVITVPELRGNPGYDEEGMYNKKGEKEGPWRKYTAEGDLLAMENYLRDGKDGLQQYYTFVGNLEREESWRAYNPDAPYDTVAIYGTGSNEIVDYKIVKTETYSVKSGDWRYYDPESGQLLRTEKWERNVLVQPNGNKPIAATPTEKKKPEKTAEMLEWEKKNKGKKGAIRDGRTGL
jgi:antitoxin component YwqK of YwqJK toxin-antitoxin module